MIYGSQTKTPCIPKGFNNYMDKWMDHLQFYNVYIEFCYLPVGQFLELNDLNESPH